jgi:hypothetical protein
VYPAKPAETCSGSGAELVRASSSEAMGEGAFADEVGDRRSRRSGEVMGGDFVEDAMTHLDVCEV